MTQGRSPQLPAHPSAENGGATASLFSYRPLQRRAGLSLISVALRNPDHSSHGSDVAVPPVNEGARPSCRSGSFRPLARGAKPDLFWSAGWNFAIVNRVHTQQSWFRQ